MMTVQKLWEKIPVLRSAGAPGAPGSQLALAEGCPWGPAVSQVLLILREPVRADSVSAEKFEVLEEKEAFDRAKPTPARFLEKTRRKVLEAVPVTSEGAETSQDSPYLLLTLAIGPDAGCPFCYQPAAQRADWCNPYRLVTTLRKPLTTAAGRPLLELDLDPVPSIGAPCLAGMQLDGTFTGPQGHTLSYASYQPAHPAGEKHPLLIWLHGAGEGGTDPAVTVLGNQVSALLGEKFQKVMSGAYLLAPQTPTFWMQYNRQGAWNDNPGVPSVYHADLMALICTYLDQHPDIDRDRVVIGGCSNGGYMTMELVMADPSLFAAAFPICEAYRDAGIRDQQLKALAEAGLPLWFVYAQNDPVVPPAVHAAPTIRRLRAMGADIHATVLPRVVDETGRYTRPDGSPYEYNGHFSWVYFFQDRCTDGGENLWSWLARQNRQARWKDTMEYPFQCLRDGLTIRGVCCRPAADQKFPVAVVSHGFRSCYPEVLRYARQLARWGYAAYCFDFNGGGSRCISDGKSTGMTVLTEAADLEAVIRYAQAQPESDPDHLILMGCSQGGFVSAMVAARLGERVEKLILYYPAFCIPDDARAGKMMCYTFDPADVPAVLEDPILSIGRDYVLTAREMDAFETIAPYRGPVLLVHGTADALVSPAYSRRAAAAYEASAPGRCQLVWVEDGTHGFDDRMDQQALAATRAFLKQ